MFLKLEDQGSNCQMSEGLSFIQYFIIWS